MAAPLKLVFYIHALAGGGAERVWSVIASRLAASGHDVVLAVDYDAEQNKAFVASGVRVVVLGGNHAQSTWRLSQLLRAEAPDVAVAALAAANLKLVVAAALAGCLRRTVLSFHGYAETEPQHLSQVGFRLAAVLSRLTARTIAVSDGLCSYLVSRWRVPENRLIRIYNPVEVRPGGASSVAELESRGPTIVAAGRFVSYKNFVGLLRAFASLPQQDARLIILGDGEERRALEAEARRLGISDRVEMPGYVTETWRYYDRARCFVLPSTSEPFGLVLVEALARGLDVVATDCDGPCEILDGGRFGVLVPRDDTRALSSGIAAVLASPSHPSARIARARAFGVDMAVDQYEAVFRDVSARRAPPSVRRDGDAAGRTGQSFFPAG